MKRIKQMLMGIFLVVVGMPLITAQAFFHTIFTVIGILLVLLGLGFEVVGFMLDEND